MNQQRLKAERLIYQIYDILDPSGRNTEFWKNEFNNMNDDQFKKYISKSFPFYFQTGAFKEPSMAEISKALDALNVPLLEPVYLPYKYKDSDGNPMKTMNAYGHAIITVMNKQEGYDKDYFPKSE